MLRSVQVNTPPETDESGLDEEVRRLLDLHRGQWQVIAIAADVSHSWLSKFTRRKITNPGYTTLKRLRALLDDRPITPPPLRITTPPAPAEPANTEPA